MRGSRGSARSGLEKPWGIVRHSRVATVRGLATGRARNRAIDFPALSPGVIPEHSYGVWPVKRAGVIRPAVCGVRFGEGSASAVVDVCVATHMRGLVPHDRVCEMRSGAVLWRRAWPLGLLPVFSRVAPRVVA